MINETLSAAQGQWRGILSTLGVNPDFLRDKHGPCPWCGGKDRFRFDDKEGSGSWFCNQCGAGKGLDFVMRLRTCDRATAFREVCGILGSPTYQGKAKKTRQERTPEEKRKIIRDLLKSAQPFAPDTPAGRYLISRCGELPDITHDLRYHPALKHSKEFPGSFPALLAILRYPDGNGASVMRVYLTQEGAKAAVDPVRKLMPGFPLESSAVRLGASQERLGIAEGIETAICAGKKFGLPVWAAISASGMRAWEPPADCRSVLICGDNDSSFTGQFAAYDLAKRLKAKGLAVEVQIPEIPDTDWCDVFNSV